MNILAFDTSGIICSVALKVANRMYVNEQEGIGQHSMQFLPMIENCLQDADLDYAQINYCVYTKGPGSFTGLRLATAVAQAFWFGLKLNTIGFSTLQVIAQHVFEHLGAAKDIPLVICEDAKMGEVYVAAYRFDSSMKLSKPLLEEACVQPAFVLEWLKKLGKSTYLFGSAVELYPELSSWPNKIVYQPLALAPDLIRLAKQTQINQIQSEPVSIMPSYLRRPTYNKKTSIPIQVGNANF